MPKLSDYRNADDEAVKYFRQIFNITAIHPAMSVDDLLKKLRQFKRSPVKREREIFSCVERMLFEERRFLRAYPENKLTVIANLFGGMIENGLLSDYQTLRMALHFVLNALKCSPKYKLFNFGLIALDRFKSRLKDFQQYCYDISMIPHFQSFPQHLIEYIRHGKQSRSPPSSSPVPRTPNHQNVVEEDCSVMTANATKVSPSECVDANSPSADSAITNTTSAEQIDIITEPPKSVRHKIGFIINNLKETNLQAKCKEIKVIVTKEYIPWFAQYLLTKRVGDERHLHRVYSKFLDTWNNDYLHRSIISETYKYIKVLLKNFKELSANDSYLKPHLALLKNFAHWLGIITIEKNKAICDLDLNMLLIEAYSRGEEEVCYTVPFVIEIMKLCKTSKEFGPRSPWATSIINFLGELYKEPQIKIWLKFNIEVMCEDLNIKLEDLKITGVLKNPEMAKHLKQQLL